jgi:hypothetical protein
MRLQQMDRGRIGFADAAGFRVDDQHGIGRAFEQDAIA